MAQLMRIDSSESLPLTFRVNQVLRSNPYLSGTHILFTAKSGAVTLRGTVDCYYQKQMAQESLRSVDDVHTVINEIEVVRL
jgi:osmotically-inducible protein OsmY